MLHQKVLKRIGAICYAILALSCCILIQGYLSYAPSETDPTATAVWDVCRLGAGLDNTEIELTTEEENALGSLIFNYPLRQITQEELARNETVYGGPFYSILFLKDNVMHHWTFSPRVITCSTSENGITGERISYEADSELLSLIGQFGG